MTIELEGCLISAYKTSMAGGKGGLPREEIKLSYRKLYINFIRNDQSGSPIRVGYDLATAEVL